jgi:hypothetical protein
MSIIELGFFIWLVALTVALILAVSEHNKVDDHCRNLQLIVDRNAEQLIQTQDRLSAHERKIQGIPF